MLVAGTNGDLLAGREVVLLRDARRRRADGDHDLLVRLQDEAGRAADLWLPVYPPLQVVAASLEAAQALRRESHAPLAEELLQLVLQILRGLDVENPVRLVRVHLRDDDAGRARSVGSDPDVLRNRHVLPV